MTKEFYLEYSNFYTKVIDQLSEYKQSGKEMRYFGPMNIEYVLSLFLPQEEEVKVKKKKLRQIFFWSVGHLLTMFGARTLHL